MHAWPTRQVALAALFAILTSGVSAATAATAVGSATAAGSAGIVLTASIAVFRIDPSDGSLAAVGSVPAPAAANGLAVI